MQELRIFSVPNFPLVKPGDDLAQLIVDGLHKVNERVQTGDILVLAQKIVSKAEGRLVRLVDVIPDPKTEELAARLGKDPRAVQVVLDDSNEILRVRRGLLVVEQKSGWVCANAGVDRSNIEPDGDSEVLAMLPADADASAEALRQRLANLTGVLPGIIINDSHGRAWRIGTASVCLGCAGIVPVWNQRGLSDLFGYELQHSEECIADELAAAASLIMGQSSEGRPVIVIRGYVMPNAPFAPAKTIQRPAEFDVFR